MIYITSDLHFYHKSIIKFTNRGVKFRSLEEMNEGIIKEWNELVKEEDTIYHLGDFSFGNYKQTKEILERLNGNKIFIKGNHDKDIFLLEEFGECYSYKEIKHNEHHICLFHFPITHWHKQEHGSIHFHGHTHGSFVNHGRSIDIGYDMFNKILSIDEAINLVKDKEVINRWK